MDQAGRPRRGQALLNLFQYLLNLIQVLLEHLWRKVLVAEPRFYYEQLSLPGRQLVVFIVEEVIDRILLALVLEEVHGPCRCRTGNLQQALGTSVTMIDNLLNLVSSRLGLDHDPVLVGRYTLPVMARYLSTTEAKFLDTAGRARSLCQWWILIWPPSTLPEAL